MASSNTTDYNSLGDYYRAIASIPLLDAASERHLATTMQEARLEQENALLEQRDPDANILHAGEIARQHFIRANLRLVVKIVNKNFTTQSNQQLQSMSKL